MLGYVVYENRKLPYQILTNKKLKNLYIELDPLKGIIVKNPNYPIKKVQEIVQKKAAWIFSKYEIIKQKISIREIYEREHKVLLFGEKIFVHVEKSLEDFYKQKTKETILPLVEKYSSLMKLYPSSIAFRKAKRRWGSCSGKNSLSFNSSIAQLPRESIEYIVIHELAHIKYKNHKKEFWSLVAEFSPQFKKHELDIKKYIPAIS